SGELLFLGLELLFLQLPRRFRGRDPLLVRLHIARDAADLRRDLQLEILQLRLRLLVLELYAREIRVRNACAQRITDRDADRPVRIGVLEDVAEDGAEAALRDDLPVDRRAERRLREVDGAQLRAARRRR